MIERKIHNHKSEIHIDYTIEQYGYHPDELGRTSTKFVICNCRFCGQVMPIRKGFFNKAGSACHKECRMKEQSICGSPFVLKEVRDKSKETNLQRYGFEYASQNKEIGQRISSGKRGIHNKKFDEFVKCLSELNTSCSSFPASDHIAVSFSDLSLAVVLNLGKECANDDRQHQLKKKQYWNNKGFRCFQIFEHQWDDRRIPILNFLRTICNLNSVKIAGRKCIVTNDECRQFLNDNHIQGYGQGSIKYFNLVYEGEIIASMTASKHHRQGQDSKNIVLNRLCFKDGFNVQGGSSKLFKKFVAWAREEKFSKIVSWSDLCWTEGGIYNVLGFELVKEYGPDYFYWDINTHQHPSKQSQQKKKTKCPLGMTEREWCLKRGLYRIWDCGKKRWEYSLLRI